MISERVPIDADGVVEYDDTGIDAVITADCVGASPEAVAANALSEGRETDARGERETDGEGDKEELADDEYETIIVAEFKVVAV